MLFQDIKHYEKLKKLYTVTSDLLDITPMETPVHGLIDTTMEAMETWESSSFLQITLLTIIDEYYPFISRMYQPFVKARIFKGVKITSLTI